MQRSCRKRAGFSFQNLDFRESDKVRIGVEESVQSLRGVLCSDPSGVGETESGASWVRCARTVCPDHSFRFSPFWVPTLGPCLGSQTPPPHNLTRWELHPGSRPRHSCLACSCSFLDVVFHVSPVAHSGFTAFESSFHHYSKAKVPKAVIFFPNPYIYCP